MRDPDRIAWVASIVITAGVAALFFVLKRRQERANRREGGDRDREKPAPRATPAWVWIFMLTVVVVMIFLQSRASRRGGGPPPGTPLVAWLTLAVPVALLLLVAALYVQAYFHPNSRVARLVKRRRFDEATALVRARMARRQLRAPASVPGDNPYAAPGPRSSGEGQAEADDWNGLGIIALERRDWPEAIACFERSEAVGAANAFIPRSNRGLALIADGRTEEGVALVEQAIGEVPAALTYSRAVIALLLAERLIESGRIAEAGPALQRADEELAGTDALARSEGRVFAARLAAARSRLDSPPGAPTGGGSS